MRPLVIGTRGSRLALWQANFVRGLLQRHYPGLEVELRIIKTSGDRFTRTALPKLNLGKGVFVKEIEEALLSEKIDLAVHSLKDLPTELPSGLHLGAVLPREDPRDALVGLHPIGSLKELPTGARIGTGSLRRRVQLQHLRADLRVEPIRGNVDTRISKIETDGLSGVVLAMAGLLRLKFTGRIAYIFPSEEMTPAVGQGALAVEIRVEDEELGNLLSPLQDQETRQSVEAERIFLHRMGGGCHVPMGAHAQTCGPEATFSAFVASPSGQRLVRHQERGEGASLAEMARKTADALLDQGAEEMLSEIEAEVQAPE